MPLQKTCLQARNTLYVVTIVPRTSILRSRGSNSAAVTLAIGREPMVGKTNGLKRFPVSL
jgi:hypothetical protein